MSEHINIDSIAEVVLSGKFGHFRKFYTNASSLTYSLPPRTAICGILASILQIKRDGYYSILSSDTTPITVSISQGISIRKLMQTLNYMADEKSYTNPSVHKQCRYELLTALDNDVISYNLWIGLSSANDNHRNLIDRISKHNLGYGVYFGQRQFSADVRLLNVYKKTSFIYLPQAEYLDSAIRKDNVSQLSSECIDVVMERMPLDQEFVIDKKSGSRRTIRIADIVFEKYGNRISGQFTDCCQLDNIEKQIISFL